MKKALVTVIATILVPGIAVFLVPYWILRATGSLPSPRVGFIEVVSIALALGGAGMVIWVSETFVVWGGGTPVPIYPPRNFITKGLYRFVRNPMYFGVLLILFAESIFFRSTWILLYAGMLWLAFHAFAVLLEEPQLERRFGGAYLDYKTRTPRWLPRRPRE